jgi:hypothetical protein
MWTTVRISRQFKRPSNNGLSKRETMKKKNKARRERRIKKHARMTAQFFLSYGHLPYGLQSVLLGYSLPDVLCFNRELGRCSMPAVQALIKPEREDTHNEDADNPDSHLPHPGRELIECGMEHHHQRFYQ